MEDNLTPNMSILLYRFLCQNIVGSEEHVKRIRLLNAVRDDVTSNQNFTFITSGSFGEGLEMRGSDTDVMSVHKGIEVYENGNPYFNPNITYFSMERDDVKPGFTQLKLEQCILQKVYEQCEEHDGKRYFSSDLYKKQWLSGSLNTIHGPCVSGEDGEFDAAFCLHCKTWISPAVQWITRSNNSWPSHEVKQCIIEHGVLFVPIGFRGSDKEDLEWRVSFSIAEKFLINSFTHTQLLCYALLKIILKDIIDIKSNCKDLLCSYFLKTIIFWISEELPQSVWKPDNVIPCLMRCFNRLMYCVESSVCWHYFIPENNMFENKIEGRSREILLETLYSLHSYGWRFILFSDQLSKFDISMWHSPIEPHTLFVNEIDKILKSRLLHIAHTAVESAKPNMSKTRIMQTVLGQRSSAKHIYKYFWSHWCNGRAHHIQVNSKSINNKNQYRHYKSCLSSLLQNVYHDTVSGWLTVASLFFKTKQYSKALHIIMYSIAKCTPEKLYLYMTMSDINKQSLILKSYRKKTFVCLLKIMFVDTIQYKMNSTLIPDELQMQESKKIHIFPSTAFAYFLNFRCHYHLNNVGQCSDSFSSLQRVIDDNYLIEGQHHIGQAHNILRIAVQLASGNES